MTHGIDYSSSPNGLIVKWSGIGLLYTWAVNGPIHALCWCEGFSYFFFFLLNFNVNAIKLKKVSLMFHDKHHKFIDYLFVFHLK